MKKVVIAFGVALAPFMVSAQILGAAPGANLSATISWFTRLMNVATILLISAAVVFFLWGVLQFVMSAGDDEAREKGKSHIIWGIIGIAVMASVWSLVSFVTSTAGVAGNTPVAAPAVPTL